ncbi:MAG: hypothetical protein SF051_08265 [Elusimicrobiota bacterium]|nr:hypothetical protein [Elusimicrobiota bacterium]
MDRNKLAVAGAALACAAAAALLAARLRSPAVDAPAPPGPELAPLASTIVTPLASSGSFTNDDGARVLVEETGRLGITGFARPQEEPPQGDGGFLGERLGQPETRERAEAAIRQLAQMRRPYEREKEKSVKLPGETAPLLGERDKGGHAIEPPESTPSPQN